MDLKSLFETPISDINHIGNFDNNYPLGFDEMDRKLITNPKAIQKTKLKWKYPKDHNTNIIFINDEKLPPLTLYGLIDNYDIKEKIPHLYDDIQNYLDSNALNIIYTTNISNNKMPPTPWIMAHRLGHALINNEHYMSAHNCFEEAFLIIAKKYGIRADHVHFGGVKESYLLDFMQNIFTFKSSRNKTLSSPFEGLQECFAQYILTGKISFRYPKEVEIKRKYLNYTDTRLFTTNDHNNVVYILDNLANELIEKFKLSMKSSVGKTLIL